MIRRFLKWLLVGGSELTLAVVLVAMLSLVLLGALLMLFPKGTGLVDLYGGLVEDRRRVSNIELSGDQLRDVTAMLTEVKRRVQQRPANAVAWDSARVGMQIEDGHAVQTLARSSATIAIEEHSRLRMDANSLLVFRQPKRSRGFQSRQASLVLLGGRVSGTIAPESDAVPLDLVTGNASAKIPAPGGSAANFSVTRNADETSTLYVYDGSAEVTSGGESRVVQSNQALTIAPDGRPGELRAIPAAPALLGPPDGFVQTYGPITPRVRFIWSASDTATAYRLTLARDRDFDEVLHDATLTDTQFAYGNLQGGSYYWRVRAIRDGVEGAPSRIWSFRIDRDVEPPELHVEVPKEVQGADRIVIRGRTDPGTEIMVDHLFVPVDEQGRFETTVALKRGLNMIVVEAVDAAGNSTYRSGYVTATY